MMRSLRLTKISAYKSNAVILFVSCLFLQSCDTKTKPTSTKENIVRPSKESVSNNVAARVNGVEISVAEVENLIMSVDGGMPKEEALDVLIQNELLAMEAKRRGYGESAEIEDVKKLELARAVLRRRIDEGVTTQSLDQEKLKNLYESNLDKFVHGVQRRVRHILFFTGEKGLPDDEAFNAASELAESAKQVDTEKEFEDLYETVKTKHPGKTRMESLPPFSKDNKRFASEFVKGTFEIPRINRSSPPVLTSFGWHVIYLVEELAAKNQSFDEIRASLSKQVLPAEKEIQFEKLIETLEKRGDIFVYDNNFPSTNPSR